MKAVRKKLTLKQVLGRLDEEAHANETDRLRRALELAVEEIAQQQIAAKSARLLAEHPDKWKRLFAAQDGAQEEAPGSVSAFVRYLLSVAQDGTQAELRTALYGAIAEIAAHEKRAKNKYPLAYWPHDYVAKIAQNPANEFEADLAERFRKYKQKNSD